MRRFLLIYFVALVRMASAAQLFFDDFEGGDTTGWNAIYAKGPGAKLTIEKSQHWSGDYAARVTISNSYSPLQMEGLFASAPKIYLRTAFYLDPALSMAPGDWITIFGPANTSIGVLDPISLVRRRDGKFILSSRACGDGATVLTPGKWLTLETMYAAGQGNGAISFWVDGVLQQSRSNLTLKDAANSVAAGALVFTWNSTPSGSLYFDNIEVSDTLGGPLQTQCILLYPELRGRAGVKMLAVLNGWQTGWHFSATLDSDGQPTRSLYNTSSVRQGAIYFPVELSALPKATYTFTAVLQDQSGAERARWSKTFDKTYDHEARLSIDSNNNITLDGQPFFPVTPFGLQESLVPDWIKGGYINCLYGQNWWQPTPETMRAYVALGTAGGIPTIGPLNLADQSVRNSDLVRDHVVAARENPDLVAYTFLDEPDYNGNPPDTVREWWQLAKTLDPTRLTHLNLMGSDFIGGGANLKLGKQWTFPHLFADIYGFDLYPFSKSNFSINSMADAADGLGKFNRGLIPFFGFVQTCNVDPSNSASRAPTPEELRIMAWILVIHGAKGIQWYHHGSGTTNECLAAMAQFTSEIKDLTPIVLNPLPAPAPVSPQANFSGAPVHLLTRQAAGKIYLFAANSTNISQLFRCSLSGIGKGARFERYGSEDTLNYGDSALEDTLAPYELRIYSTKKLDPPTNLRAVAQ